MKTPDFLPLGSVVVIKGNVKKLMIIARGLALKHEGEVSYFDYGACTYPEGLIGDQVIYFNHDVILKKVFDGFSDEDERMMIENLKTTLAGIDMKKGDPKPVAPVTQEADRG